VDESPSDDAERLLSEMVKRSGKSKHFDGIWRGLVRKISSFRVFQVISYLGVRESLPGRKPSTYAPISHYK
jgi:hypothetical protein